MSIQQATLAEHYRYSVQWSPADEEFVATVAEFPSLSWLDADQLRAIQGVEQLVSDIIVDLVESGEEVPPPLASRTFSGRLNLRVDPELHRRLATKAINEGISINRYAAQLLDC
ncbi:toxin-antitoxin system HicB family antitoxin [Paeniglutamicibacter gangotriensis]|uniref:Toxin-antitoxin system HicB family antitoxin n=1 Tax=Paeniglutamicibacter gangotriensis TaxID=254787 RepID=A0A5B0EIV9_9MICC|nr:toxin-antitoxin system HicB family antitoxin [Paeniglutamicibacter gangotriensis]KAA0978626.1 toxin-antitoxin system HicB family antitoxin [Paeniglutamicibacter gangotriensis]